MVSGIVEADLLILLSDIDGLYTANPQTHADATIIPVVKEIDKNLFDIAGGAGSSMGTGGMYTKSRLPVSPRQQMSIWSSLRVVKTALFDASAKGNLWGHYSKQSTTIFILRNDGSFREAVPWVISSSIKAVPMP